MSLPGPRPQPYDDSWLMPDGRDPFDGDPVEALPEGITPERYLLRVALVITILFLVAILVGEIHWIGERLAAAEALR